MRISIVKENHMVNKTMLNEIKNLEACKRNMYMKFKQILFLREKYCKKFAIGRKNIV